MQQSALATSKINATSTAIVSNIDKFIFFVCVIDTLFFPYIRVLSASLSMILLPIWYVFNLKKIRLTFEFKLFVPLAFFITLSVAISAMTFPESLFFKSNMTYAVILLYGFLYYFFYKYYLESTHTPLNKILKFYILFGFTLSAVYLASPSLYFKVRSFWTMSGDVIKVDDSLIIHRFTSTFSDPNNAAVAFVAVMTFLLFQKKISFLQSVFLIGATAFILFATMSTTGFIVFIISLFFYFSSLFLTKKVVRFKKSTLFHLGISCILSPLFLWILYTFFGSELAEMSFDRVSGNSASSRFEIWQTLLTSENIFKYLLYGLGGTIVINGIDFNPHNGHLHLIYNYGMIVYAAFLYIFFRKRKNTTLRSYFFLVPFFLGFTVNVGIYEPRFINLIALLVASYASYASYANKAT